MYCLAIHEENKENLIWVQLSSNWLKPCSYLRFKKSRETSKLSVKCWEWPTTWTQAALTRWILSHCYHFSSPANHCVMSYWNQTEDDVQQIQDESSWKKPQSSQRDGQTESWMHHKFQQSDRSYRDVKMISCLKQPETSLETCYPTNSHRGLIFPLSLFLGH